MWESLKMVPFKSLINGFKHNVKIDGKIIWIISDRACIIQDFINFIDFSYSTDEINFQKLLVNKFDEEKILVSLIDSSSKNHRRYFFIFIFFSKIKYEISPWSLYWTFFGKVAGLVLSRVWRDRKKVSTQVPDRLNLSIFSIRWRSIFT